VMPTREVLRMLKEIRGYLIAEDYDLASALLSVWIRDLGKEA